MTTTAAATPAKSTRSQIATRYGTHRTSGAGRIVAVVTSGPDKGRRLTRPYDHAAGHGSHQLAAAELAARLELGTVDYAGTDVRGAHVRDIWTTASNPPA